MTWGWLSRWGRLWWRSLSQFNKLSVGFLFWNALDKRGCVHTFSPDQFFFLSRISRSLSSKKREEWKWNAICANRIQTAGGGLKSDLCTCISVWTLQLLTAIEQISWVQTATSRTVRGRHRQRQQVCGVALKFTLRSRIWFDSVPQVNLKMLFWISFLVLARCVSTAL